MNSALLIHAGAVGDFVMSLRIVAALREAGAARVTVLGKPEIAGIAIPGGNVDAVIDLNAGGYHRLFLSESALTPPVLEAMREFDWAVDMLGGPGSAVVANLRQAGIPKVVGIDPRPRPGWTRHVSDQWLADVRTAGIKATPGPPAIRLSADRRRGGRRLLCEARGLSETRLAVVHPGSGSRQKCWPLTGFAELARTLQTLGWGVVVLLGPVEMERFTPTELALLHATAPTIAGRLLHEAADVIAAADLFIGNDSGMSHLAAALGTPTVAIYGPTDPVLWGALGAQVSHVGPAPDGTWPAVTDAVRAVAELT